MTEAFDIARLRVLRAQGASVYECSRALGVSPDRIKQALRHYGLPALSGDSRPVLTVELVDYLYWEVEMTLEQIGLELHIQPRTVREFMVANDIPRRRAVIRPSTNQHKANVRPKGKGHLDPTGTVRMPRVQRKMRRGL